MVTADPLTLSLRFAAMGELKHAFTNKAKHSFICALFRLLMRIRSAQRTKKNPLRAGCGGLGWLCGCVEIEINSVAKSWVNRVHIALEVIWGL